MNIVQAMAMERVAHVNRSFLDYQRYDPTTLMGKRVGRSIMDQPSICRFRMGFTPSSKFWS